MKTFITPTALILFLSSFLQSAAQSDPLPFNMNTNGNYFFDSWSPSSSPGTYPSSMVFHNMGPVAPITLSSVATSDITGNYNENNGTRINGANNDGILFANETKQTAPGFEANRSGEVVVALNTIGRTNISLSFIAGTNNSGTGSSVSKLRAQYRVFDTGSWGPWKEIAASPVEYTSSSIVPSSQSFGPVVLPAEVNDKANIQIRWLFYYDSGVMNNGYKSPLIRLDDIQVSSQPIVNLTDQPVACSMENSVPLTGGSPSGGIYSGPFVSSGNFNASSAGTGIHTITYTYTDVHGISNSASATIEVDLMACSTQLTPAFCGATNLNLGQNIFTTTVPGAADYEFQFVNQSNGFTVTKTRGNSNPVIYLGSVPGLSYGATYDVRVRFRAGSLWSDYGNICTISIQNSIPLTALTASSCGASSLTLNSTIYTNIIPGASDYEFEFTNTISGSVVTKNRGNSNPLIYLASVPGLQYGASYHVRVRSKVAGMWSQYGASCTITIQPVIPATQLTAASCGATGLTLNNTIYTMAVAGATDYEFHFTNPVTGFTTSKTRGNSNALMPLGNVPGLTYGDTYNVIVRSRVGGIWSAYGPSCTIALSSSIPLTQLSSYSCNATGLSTTDYIYINGVAGATDYEYKISCGSFPFNQNVIRGNSTTHLPLAMVPGLQDGYTYIVEVRSYVGGVWSAYGNPCEITIGTPVRQSEFTAQNISSRSLNTKIYPNPSSGIFNIEASSDENIIIQVYNIQGQIILERSLNAGRNLIDLNEFPEGAYLARVQSSSHVNYHKIIIGR